MFGQVVVGSSPIPPILASILNQVRQIDAKKGTCIPENASQNAHNVAQSCRAFSEHGLSYQCSEFDVMTLYALVAY
jgi:hypothetical protein